MFPLLRSLFAWWFIGSVAFAQEPEWIWAGKSAAANEVRFFRTSFTLPGPVKQALLSLSCDNRAEVYVNGREVARSSEWQQPVVVDLREALHTGENILAVKARNDDGVAALIARVEITFADGRKQIVATNAAWLNSDKQTAGWNENRPAAIADWKPSVSLGKLGVAPWGDVFSGNSAGRVRGTPTNDLKTVPGFAGELLYAAQPGDGSWIALTVDPRGRLIISPQNRVSSTNGGMLRVTIGADGKVGQVERLTTPLGAAMGLLTAFDSLYVDGEGPKGYGLYRLRDTDRDDQYETADFLLKLGNGEHGSHGIVHGPDNALYLMVGNHVKPPKEISPNGPLKNFAEDLLLPRQWDANGHAVGILAPGGYILRSGDEGKTWELFCGGFRNAYDLDFNLHGELFTFDSDMEWDIGAPWYRPTRIYHCVSGGEYGWRSGTGKWPVYYPDALPPTLDVGPGSPTGVRFGTPAVKWPLRYQRALYAMDWAYGKIYAIHLATDGSSYRGEKEEFVSGKPLNVTDLEFHNGAMYFITGGRGTASALYRVTHRATDNRASNSAPADAPRPLAELRRALEKFHGKADPNAVEKAWPHLDSPDRFVRASARIAIEWQPVAGWQQRALLEKRPRAALEALLALARCGSNNLKPHLCEAITTLTLEQMDESQQLAAMRIVGLTFLRMGSPIDDERRQMLDLWSRFFPAKTEPLNRELSQLLVYLESPEVVQQTMALLARAPSQEEQMHYAFVLRNARHGWTPELRRQYFAWFDKAKREYKGGASFQKFLVNMKRDAIEKLSPDDRVALADLLDQAPARTAPPAPAKSAAPRGFVRLWTMADLDPLIRAGKGSAARGKAIYAEAQCASCHRFGGEGGSSGPDLTGAGARFNRRDMLEAIVQPSKVISDQYRNVMITTAAGKVLTGRIVDQSPEKITLLENPLSADRTEIATSVIRGREESPVSAMPEGLLSLFSREEILDLLTFLESVPEKDP